MTVIAWVLVIYIAGPFGGPFGSGTIVVGNIANEDACYSLGDKLKPHNRKNFKITCTQYTRAN